MLGLLNESSAVAFGDGIGGIVITAGAFSGLALTNMAFSVPRDGTIDSIAAFFSVTAGLSLLGSTVTVRASLFEAPAGSNTFTLIPTATVNIIALSGTVSIGDADSALATGLGIPVTAGTRLLMVVSASVTDGLDVATAIVGYFSGGVSIV